MREWGHEKHRTKFRWSASILVLVPIVLMFVNISVYLWKIEIQEKATLDTKFPFSRRRLLTENEENCTKPAVFDFPHIRIRGGLVGQLILPFIASIYLYILLARVCDDYFIASIKVICSKIGFSGDVAGATLMAAATASPELFVNLVGTFVTQGNIGVGTIIGSIVFNILAVPGLCCVFATSKVIKLDYWPLIRDSIYFCVSLFVLCFVLRDDVIQWYEALLMVITYASYIVMMNYNNIIRSKFESVFFKFSNKSFIFEDPATWPLLNSKQANNNNNNNNNDFNGHVAEEVIKKQSNEDLEKLCCWPPGSSILKKLWWLFTWPITFVLACTIPNCRFWSSLYMLTFVMSVLWIAVGSYVIAWMITISGYVLRIPDSVMGLTFIAAGMCIPETISSIIVSRQGQGSMALANALGSNIFDVLFCFGVPWLIKTTYFTGNSSNEHFIKVPASGLVYDTVILLVSLLLLIIIVAANNFQLTKRAGYFCLLLYLVFIGCSVIIELHVTTRASSICTVDFNT